MDALQLEKSQSDEEAIDLSRYMRVLLRTKWRLMFLVLVSGLIAGLIAFSMTPVYEASTTVLIENQQAKVVSIESVYGLNASGSEYYQTQFEILKSRELAERVVGRLNLVKHPLFDPTKQPQGLNLKQFLPFDTGVPELSEEEIFSIVVNKLIGGLSIEPVRNTQLVKIKFQSVNSELAAVVANTMSQVFIESHLEAKLELTKTAASWLGTRLGGLRETLQQSEKRLQDYREQANLVDIQGVQTLSAGELDQITQRYVETANLRSRAETLYKQITSLGSSASTEEHMSIPNIASDAGVSEFKRAQAMAQRKVAELGKRYGKKHPAMIAATSELDTANEQLRAQVLTVAEGIKSAYRGALQTEKTLENQMSQTKQQLQQINRKEFRLRDLEREVETNRQLYDMFLTRSRETTESEGLQAAHARVVDPAVVPNSPVKPNRNLIIVLAMLVSGVFGGAVAIALDALNNTIRTSEDIEEKLKAPMLGFLPLVKSNKSDAAYEGFLSDHKGNFAESVRTVRTSLVLSNLDDPHKITLVTSSVPGEGKSTVSINLSEALGQMESVLLIDADMRRPTVGRTLGLPRNAPGLSNLVAGTASVKECVRKIEGTSVSVMPAGIIPANPLELLSSKRFSAALQQLSQHFDRIVLDSAPTHSVSDAMVLSTYANAVVYVVKSDSTSAQLAAKGIRRLREVDAPVSGVVLNQVDLDKASSYGSYYADYYSNYGYYQSTEDEMGGSKAQPTTG